MSGIELQRGHLHSRADKAASAYMCKLRPCEHRREVAIEPA